MKKIYIYKIKDKNVGDLRINAYICKLYQKKHKTMKTIVLATHNKHKLEEFKAMLGDKMTLISLDEIDLHDEIPETGTTFTENARQKASYVFDKIEGKYDVMADDSGLEVEALDGEPGVWSARYAGEGCSSQDNIDKLLKKMNGITKRDAKFVTVLALISKNGIRYFQGEVRGFITEKMNGKGGFGYDPIFIPDGETLSFGELPAETKNKMSHRANAIKELLKKL